VRAQRFGLGQVPALLVSAGAVTALMVAVPATAQAAPIATGSGAQVMGWPSECHTSVHEFRKYTSAWCANPNGGEYRAIAICEGPRGTVHRYGGWVRAGQSDAYCQGVELARAGDGVGIESRP
jgi:hypothetical protein